MVRRRLLHTLSFQILLALAMLVVTAVVLMGLLASYIAGINLTEEKRHLGTTVLTAAAHAATANAELPGADEPLFLAETAQRVGQLFYDARSQHSLTFFLRDGSLLWSSLPREQWETARFFGDGLTTGLGEVSIRPATDPPTRRGVLVFRAPFLQRGAAVGAIQLVLPLTTPGEDLLISGKFVVLLAAAYALVVILIGLVLLRQTIVQPLNAISRAVGRLAQGERNIELEVRDPEELGELARNINALTRELAEHEQRVGEQIEELLSVNDELETTRMSLIRSEKLASIGRLAAGVAHEVGNPLAAILGYVDLLRKGGLPDDVVQDFLRRIEEDTSRIHAIITGLLDYSRARPDKIERLDLNRVVEETIELLHLQKPFKRIAFDIVSHRRPAEVKADASKLQQVLVNLFLNAGHAMNGEGTITLFLERVLYDPASTYRQNAAHFHRGDSLITLSVIDQGIGMDEETQVRIFDPFFTTKEPGQGTGLGLSVSDKIIDAFGGTIDVRSRPGEGATFTLLLPEAAPEADKPT